MIPRSPKIKVGATVVFGFFMGDTITVAKQDLKYRIVGTHQVFGVLNNKDDGLMDLDPVEDNVVIKLLPEETQTPGGIVIPIPSRKGVKAAREGTVVTVGEGKPRRDGKLHPIDLKVGDVVSFTPFGAIESKMLDDDHVVIPESVVFGVRGK